tara:strand:+ start:127 stop:606 length:480 start_codon:yes stop_codon:yes gene_type:complete
MKTILEKEIRKKKKMIRRLKSKENWNMEKINSLDNEVLKMEELIRKEKEIIQKEKEKKQRMDEMDDDDWIEYYHEDPIEEVEKHIIPNNRKTRIKRKEIIHKINEDILGKHMENQIKIRMEIINQIKKKINDSSSDSSSDEEKEFEKIRKEMYSHFESV